MTDTADPTRAALERQLAFLLPVAERLGHAAVLPDPLGDDWRGPAADGATRFHADLRLRLRDAEHLALEAIRAVRLRLAGLP